MRFGRSNQSGDETQALLIGDADRDQISAVLSQHVAEGRLTLDELEQRLNVLLSARTRPQAGAAVAGLPALSHPQDLQHFPFWSHHDSTPELPAWLRPEGVHVDARTRKPPKIARWRHKRAPAEDYEASLRADEAQQRAKAREAQQLYEDLLKARTVDTSIAWSCPMCGHVNHADNRRCTECRHEF